MSFFSEASEDQLREVRAKQRERGALYAVYTPDHALASGVNGGARRCLHSRSCAGVGCYWRSPTLSTLPIMRCRRVGDGTLALHNLMN